VIDVTDFLMNPLDAVWLMMESDDTPMHSGVLAIFRKPRNASTDYLNDLAGKLRAHRTPVAPWNLKLAASSMPLSPRLVPVNEIDLDYHFRHTALPSPGGERELGVMISLLHSNALDRDRPLWEFHLIEGLEKDRFALYVKVHHAMVDNVNGIPMLLAMLSASARKKNMPPLWSQPLRSDFPGEEEDSAGLDLFAGFAAAVESVNSIGRVASGFIQNAFTKKEGGSFLVPRGTPRSTLNRRINSQRRIATQQFEQKRIEALARATDSTVNEILTYLCGSCLRRFFKEYNALPDESLIAAVPVSLQERSERLPGNAIAGLRVSLGTHIGDPLARLQAVKTSIQRVRRDRASLPDVAATSYVMMRAVPVYASCPTSPRHPMS
jgi:WS/DGAT/MGAT family acyltransferase